MSETLVPSLAGLLERAIGQARTPETRARLEDAHERLLGPLRLAIAGKVKAGKSTLLNALLGEELAPTDAGECTRIVSWYHWGHSPQVMVHPLAGPAVLRPWKRSKGALDVELGSLTAEEIDRIDVAWPTSRLQELTVLDTPGIASIRTEVSDRTHRVLSADATQAPVADAVLYLMRHTHSSDVRFLEAFHDDDLAQGTPVNAIGVLSRADEIGACLPDAMEVASRIADRYQHDPRIRRLCPIIVPVNGLLAHASVTLRESDFSLLAAMAGGPADEVDQLLMTVDRVVDPERCPAVSITDRARLLDRLGLFGVRVAIDRIQTRRATTASELAEQLAELSGLVQLRGVVLRQFDLRSRVLKARSALAVLNDVLQAGGCRDAGPLLGAVEQLSASTHEFEEVRLLGAIRAGQVELDPALLAGLDLILGGSGHDARSRLGLDPDAGAGEVRSAALKSLAFWRAVAEHPLYSRPVSMAARVAIRTIEGIVAAHPLGAAQG